MHEVRALSLSSLLPPSSRALSTTNQVVDLPPLWAQWLVVAHGRACPVCKAVLTVDQLVPIYTSAEAIDPR